MGLFNFCNIEEHQNFLRESAQKDKNYKDLEEQYLKLRKEHFELRDKCSEDSVDTLILNNQKLTKDIKEARELLTQYHIWFGDSIAEKMQRKVDRKNKKNIDEVEK